MPQKKLQSMKDKVEHAPFRKPELFQITPNCPKRRVSDSSRQKHHPKENGKRSVGIG